MRNIILLTLIVLASHSCKSSKLILGGTYIGTFVYLEYHLTLRQDNIFLYDCSNGMNYEQNLVSGIWRREGDCLLLDSRDTLMQQPLPLNVQESILVNNDSAVFKLNVPQSNDYINWTLVLNNRTYPFLQDSMNVVIDTNTIQQFYLFAERNPEIVLWIPRKTVQTQAYTGQNLSNKLIELSIPISKQGFDNYARYELINDTLVMKKNKLVWARKNVTLKHYKE